MINLIHGDCMEAMKGMKDNQFDLAIIDPPYGNDNIHGGYTSGRGGGLAKQKKYNQSLWEQCAPDKSYFSELKRVSNNQIIWGANHLINNINDISSGWIFWDKLNGDVSFSDGELAYTSFNVGFRRYSFRWHGFLKDNNGDNDTRQHPTQKPVALYKWLLKNYAKEGDKILDTHGGSMSIAIACHDLKFDLDLYEIDKDYYEAGLKRFNQHKAQLTIF